MQAGNSKERMETSRPKKPLSLKQRKLTFKPTTTDTNCNTHIQAPPSTSRLVPNEIELPKDQPEGISRSETIQTSLPNGLLFSGLCNLGNTCYVNSVLQALRFCPGFGAGVTKMESAMQPIDEEDNVEAIDSLSTLLSKVIKLFLLYYKKCIDLICSAAALAKNELQRKDHFQTLQQSNIPQPYKT